MVFIKDVTSNYYCFHQTFCLLCSYSLEVSLAVQQPPVLCDLGLQLHLDVEQQLVLLCVVLDVAADLSELLLQPQNDHVVLLYLHVVTHLDVTQSGLQGCFLPRGEENA